MSRGSFSALRISTEFKNVVESDNFQKQKESITDEGLINSIVMANNKRIVHDSSKIRNRFKEVNEVEASDTLDVKEGRKTVCKKLDETITDSVVSSIKKQEIKLTEQKVQANKQTFVVQELKETINQHSSETVKLEQKAATSTSDFVNSVVKSTLSTYN